MKKLLIIGLTLLMGMPGWAQVLTGIEVLEQGGFEELKGKRVGLVTNPSGIDNNLKSQRRGPEPPFYHRHPL